MDGTRDGAQGGGVVVEQIVVAVAVAVAAVIDWRTGRIPNRLVVPLAAAGLLWHAWQGGWPGMIFSLLGFCVGFGLFLPPYLLGGLGGGDLKLAAAIGACLGPQLALVAILYSAVAGGFLAAVLLARQGRLRSTVRGLWNGLVGLLAGAGWASSRTLARAAPGDVFPYGVAMAVGTLAALWTTGVAP